jgi:uncharacterized protein
LSTLTLGVIADTHIPDRMRALPRQVGDVFQGVTAILHAGDVSSPRVLEELERLAPVYAVAGNRDFPRLRLPKDRVLEFGGVRIGLTHGHGDWGRYLYEKVRYITGYYDGPRYVRLARARFGEVDVVVFGHTHRAVCTQKDGALVFNPGSVGPDYYAPNFAPAVGLLRITDGQVSARIVVLK